jgi:NAD(P)-dependent dehydrogenase (short-subunit alcohol dehydrogenase family)
MTDGPYSGRIALVTGASRGIGRAVALGLAKAGAHGIVAARSVAARETLDDEIQQAGGTATLLQLDLRKGDRIDQLGPTLYQRWQHLDIFVGNAGILGPLSPLSHVTEEGFLSTIEVNLTANWRLIRTLEPVLKNSNAGRAVFLSSGAASGKYAYWGPYAASKAAVHHLTRTLAIEFAARRITVNAFAPGPFQSRMTAFATATEEQAKHVGNHVPLGRVGLPDDIAGATLYLCSRAGGYVTGAILPIDGGQSVQHGMTLFNK